MLSMLRDIDLSQAVIEWGLFCLGTIVVYSITMGLVFCTIINQIHYKYKYTRSAPSPFHFIYALTVTLNRLDHILKRTSWFVVEILSSHLSPVLLDYFAQSSPSAFLYLD